MPQAKEMSPLIAKKWRKMSVEIVVILGFKLVDIVSKTFGDFMVSCCVGRIQRIDKT